MAGDCDFLLRVVAGDLEGVRSLKTDIPMQTIKLSPALPLASDPLRR